MMRAASARFNNVSTRLESCFVVADMNFFVYWRSFKFPVILSLCMSVLVVNNNMLNIKINTSRVKVIAFFSSSTSIIICSAS